MIDFSFWSPTYFTFGRGAGKYAPVKTKIALKAAANKGYVFAGWEGDVVSQAASLSFTMPSNDVEYVTRFVTAEEDKASIELAVNGEEMRLAGDGSPHQTNVWAGVYLEWPVAASALSETKVKVAGLPSGLKFTDKPVTSKIGSGKTAVVVTNVPANTIYGAPTAASKVDKNGNVTPSAVKITVTTAGKSSQTFVINLYIDPLPAWAVGTFDGYVRGSGTLAASGEDGSGEGSGESAASPKGLAAVTVSAAGKISGKILEGGKTWTLSAAWFDEVRLAGDGSPYQVTLYAPPKPTAKPPFEGFCKTLAVRLTLDEQRVVTKAVIVDEILDDWLNSNPDEEDEEDFYGPS